MANNCYCDFGTFYHISRRKEPSRSVLTHVLIYILQQNISFGSYMTFHMTLVKSQLFSELELVHKKHDKKDRSLPQPWIPPNGPQVNAALLSGNLAPWWTLYDCGWAADRSYPNQMQQCGADTCRFATPCLPVVTRYLVSSAESILCSRRSIRYMSKQVSVPIFSEAYCCKLPNMEQTQMRRHWPGVSFHRNCLLEYWEH